MQTVEAAQPLRARSLWIYCLRTAFLASIPTLLGVCAVLASSYSKGMDLGGKYTRFLRPDLTELLGNIVFAPVAETGILVAGLLLLSRLGWSAMHNSFICALSFGVLHGVLQGWGKFPVAAWGFYFFAQAFQTWQSASLTKGVLAALLPHVIVNSAVMAALAAYSM